MAGPGLQACPAPAAGTCWYGAAALAGRLCASVPDQCRSANPLGVVQEAGLRDVRQLLVNMNKRATAILAGKVPQASGGLTAKQLQNVGKQAASLAKQLAALQPAVVKQRKEEEARLTRQNGNRPYPLKGFVTMSSKATAEAIDNQNTAVSKFLISAATVKFLELNPAMVPESLTEGDNAWPRYAGCLETQNSSLTEQVRWAARHGWVVLWIWHLLQRACHAVRLHGVSPLFKLGASLGWCSRGIYRPRQHSPTTAPTCCNASMPTRIHPSTCHATTLEFSQVKQNVCDRSHPYVSAQSAASLQAQAVLEFQMPQAYVQSTRYDRQYNKASVGDAQQAAAAAQEVLRNPKKMEHVRKFLSALDDWKDSMIEKKAGPEIINHAQRLESEHGVNIAQSCDFSEPCVEKGGEPGVDMRGVWRVCDTHMAKLLLVGDTACCIAGKHQSWRPLTFPAL